jgi:hypothetical protein
LFQFEVVSISVAASDEKCAPFDERPERQTLHLWLCGRCASGMTVVLEPAQGVKVVTLEERSHEAPELARMGQNISSGKEC